MLIKLVLFLLQILVTAQRKILAIAQLVKLVLRQVIFVLE